MNLALKIVVGMVLSALAPIVVLVYRRGWFDTPDDNVSPRGMYEERVRKINERFGNWVSDYYWLALRNRAYGYDYAMKPQHFKDMKDYSEIESAWTQTFPRWYGSVRYIQVDGFYERTYSIGKGKVGFHVITGYRLRPVYDEWYNNRFNAAGIPYRPINMDARPIFSLRAGTQDD